MAKPDAADSADGKRRKLPDGAAGARVALHRAGGPRDDVIDRKIMVLKQLLVIRASWRGDGSAEGPARYGSCITVESATAGGDAGRMEFNVTLVEMP